MTFDSIIGQKNVKKVLSDSIVSERVGHAYLFHGPAGIGKKLTARAYAEAVMCLHPNPDGTACGKCEACVLNKNHSNPDLKIYEIQKNKKGIIIEQARDIVQDAMTVPYYSNKKVFIIQSGETMNLAAQNALLKILEEPPKYVMIIILTTNIAVILDTIKSRTSRIDFARYDNEEIEAILKANGIEHVDESALAYADGIAGRAISFYNDDKINEIRGNVLKIAEGLAEGDAAYRIESAEYLASLKKDTEFVIYTLLSYYSDVSKAARYGKSVKITNKECENPIRMTASRLGFYKAQEIEKIINKAWGYTERSINIEVVMSNMLIQIQEVING